MVNKKTIKRTFENRHMMILDPANVVGLINVPNQFYDEDDKVYKMDWIDKPIINNHIKVEDDNDIKFSLDKKKMHVKDTVISAEYVTWFLKICKVFFGYPKLKTINLEYYVNKDEKDYPMLVCFNNLGCVIAPKIEDM